MCPTKQGPTDDLPVVSVRPTLLRGAFRPLFLAAFLTSLTPGGSLGQEAAAGSVSDAVVNSSDPELAARASAILADVEAWSGLEAISPVRVETRSRRQLTDYLLSKLDTDMPPERAAAVAEAYRLFGLVPADFDLRSTLLAVYREQVAGFYEPDSAALFLIADQEEPMMKQVLVHELVHALQDQRIDLAALIDSDETGTDRAAAAHAAIEGHAMVVTVISGAPAMASNLGMIETVFGRMRSSMEAMVVSTSPELARAPRVVREPLVSSYVDGGIHVLRMWREFGRDVEFDRLIPASTDQLLGAPLSDRPVELELEIDGGETLYESQLGRRELAILIDELLGEGWDGLAAGWGGDRFALVDGKGGRGLVWFLVADTPDDRDAIFEAIGDGASELGGPAEVTVREIDGHPGLELRIGEFGGIEVGASVRKNEEGEGGAAGAGSAR